MVIQCEKCSTRFKLPDEKLKPEGVKVRCSHCKEVFTVFATPPEPPPALEPSSEETAPEPSEAFSAGGFDESPSFDTTPAGDDDFGSGFDEGGADGASGFAFDSPDSEPEAVSGEVESAAAPKDDFGFDFSEEAATGDGQSPNEFSFDETGWGNDSAAGGGEGRGFDEPAWGESQPSAAGGGGAEFSLDRNAFDMPEAQTGQQPSSAGEAGKEFKFTELAPAERAPEPGGLSSGFGEDVDIPDEHDRDLDTLVPEPPVKRKPSSSSATLFILLLILAIVAGVGAFFLWQQGQLPVVDEFLSRLRGDAAVAGRIEVSELTHAVVRHPVEGDLFVIRGTAFNRYVEPRSALQVKGELYAADSKVLAQQLAYCGNPLDDAALRGMSFEEIREAMRNQFGEVLSNLNVLPGKGIPFTIVFKGVPQGLSEFGVSVVDSQAGSR